MNAVLKIGTIFCWAIAIGLEYITQKWPRQKKLLNIIAAGMFAFALFGEYLSYRYDSAEQVKMQSAIDAAGIPETKWFMAKDAEQQDFEIPELPIEQKVDVLINGLIEPDDVYSLHGRIVTVMTPLKHTDQITIKYRRHH